MGGKPTRTRFIHEEEDPLNLLDVNDATRGIRSKKTEDSEDSEEVSIRSSMNSRWNSTRRVALSCEKRRKPRGRTKTRRKKRWKRIKSRFADRIGLLEW